MITALQARLEGQLTGLRQQVRELQAKIKDPRLTTSQRVVFERTLRTAESQLSKLEKKLARIR